MALFLFCSINIQKDAIKLLLFKYHIENFITNLEKTYMKICLCAKQD